MWLCIRYRNRLGAFLDGELNARQRNAVATHVGECAACRTALEQMRGLESILLAIDVPTPPVDLTTRILNEARARHRSGRILSKNRRPWRGPAMPRAWAFKVATVTALLIGLTAGSFLGWNIGWRESSHLRNAAQARTNRMQQDLYALDAFSSTPAGSIEAATLALLGDPK